MTAAQSSALTVGFAFRASLLTTIVSLLAGQTSMPWSHAMALVASIVTLCGGSSLVLVFVCDRIGGRVAKLGQVVAPMSVGCLVAGSVIAGLAVTEWLR